MDTAGGQDNWEKLLRALGQGHTQLSCPYANALVSPNISDKAKTRGCGRGETGGGCDSRETQNLFSRPARPSPPFLPRFVAAMDTAGGVIVGARRAGIETAGKPKTSSPARLARPPRPLVSHAIAIAETAGGQANWEKLLRALGQGHTQLSCPYINVTFGETKPAGAARRV